MNRGRSIKHPVRLDLPATVLHLAEADNWPLIEKHGLLPANELLARSELSKEERQLLRTRQRTTHTHLPSGAQIRDQKPMPAAALEKCLIGMSPAQWYALINSHVFFWLDYKRLNRQRAASEPRPQIALVVDTRALASACEGRLFVTPINTGNARRNPALRGEATFVAHEHWRAQGWASEAAAFGTPQRPRSHAPVELAVRGPVPNFNRYVLDQVALPSGASFVPPLGA